MNYNSTKYHAERTYCKDAAEDDLITNAQINHDAYFTCSVDTSSFIYLFIYLFIYHTVKKVKKVRYNRGWHN